MRGAQADGTSAAVERPAARPPRHMPSLSIIIPAYNEAENIVDTLDNVTRALEGLAIRHEILVIDDGSADATAALVTSNLNRFPAVRLLVNERSLNSERQPRTDTVESGL